MLIAICDDEQVILKDITIMVDEIMDEYGCVGEIRKFNNGIEVAKRIRDFDKEAVIIFLTSYQEWMPEAFDVQAFNYLLKPIDRKKLEEVFKKIFNYLSDRKVIFYFKQGNKLYSIPYKNIYYFESDKRKIKIVTDKGEYYYYDTISNIQKIVGEELFTRTHVSYFINMDYIRNFDGKDVILENGISIPVSKKFVELFNISFMKYLKKRC
jgi:DNA-binding LytR/AlgR family response regulator